MENSKPAPITKGPQDGQNLSVVGDTYRILITGKETGGAYAAIDMLIPPNGGPGPHSHAGFQESFYVIDGEIEVKSEGSTYIAKKGSFVNIPKGGIVYYAVAYTSPVLSVHQQVRVSVGQTSAADEPASIVLVKSEK